MLTSPLHPIVPDYAAVFGHWPGRCRGIDSFSFDNQLLHQLVPLGVMFFRFFHAVFLVYVPGSKLFKFTINELVQIK